ncbi:hypothetical protein [Nitrosomonas mobilis]|uniref:hypothetical protein n=1 Tax=Nitrosomonas mobilis TaxID=51642 RepID=UPI000B7FEC93|nr:hypothetical protein [Nitrosomonas mobilis]
MRDKLASNNTNVPLPLEVSAIPCLGIEPASAKVGGRGSEDQKAAISVKSPLKGARCNPLHP